MESLLQNVSNQSLVPIGGLLLGVVGIVLAIVFYVRSRRTSKLRYDFTGESLVERLTGALDGIEVRYKGEPQNRVTVVRFVFWNAGTETLRADDFTDDALRIVTEPSINVLDHRIIDSSDPTNRIVLADATRTIDDEVSVAISFDYLDPRDGAVIQLVHDGPASTRFELAGSLKSNCLILKAESPVYSARRFFKPFPFLFLLLRSRVFGWMGASIYVSMGILALVIPIIGKGSWWLLALSAFGWLGAWIMLYAYVFGQVPSRLQRELSRLPKFR